VVEEVLLEVEVDSVLVEEEAAEVAEVSREAAAVGASHQEEEAVRGVVSHEGVVNTWCRVLLVCVDFWRSGLYQVF